MVISKDFVKMLLFATIAATPRAWVLNNQFLQNVYPRINLGFGVFVLGILLLFVIGFIIIFSQTFKAAQANPTETLNYE